MRSISLASGTLPEFEPQVVVDAAATAGFDACGIWFDADRWTADTTRAVRSAFQATGLKPLEIEVIVLGDPERSASVERLLETGAELGATDAIVVSREAEIDRTVDLLGALNELARANGVRLCLEFLPIFAVADLTMASAVLDGVGDDNVKLLVDPLHVARSGAELDDLAALPSSWFSFAQFCDAPAAAPGDGGFEALYDEALNGRLLPGDGELPLAEIVAALPADLPLSLELRARWLREDYPDPVQRARIVLESTRAWLDARGEFSGA